MTADRLLSDYRDGVFHSQRHYFEQTNAAYQRIADSDGYRARPQVRAGALREAAHYAAWASKATAWKPPGAAKNQSTGADIDALVVQTEASEF